MSWEMVNNEHCLVCSLVRSDETASLAGQLIQPINSTGLGEDQESISEFASNVNWEALVQLSMVAAIMIAGPVVIFLLAFRGGNL
jgi:hypothetical protein